MYHAGTLSEILERKHGDLSRVIPDLVNKYGQVETARRLGVRTAWVNKWLKTNGYVLVFQYVKADEVARL